jgi:hypothetical protein
MTLTVDRIESGAPDLLRDMERLNLIWLNPPEKLPRHQRAASLNVLTGRFIFPPKNTPNFKPLCGHLALGF